jgi:hypothetical protein
METTYSFLLYGKIKKSYYAEKMSIAENKILIFIPTIWVKGQRYKVRAFIYFEFSKNVLNKVYINPTTYSYIDYQGNVRAFASLVDLVETIKDDKRMQTIESMGVLSNEE